MKGYLELAAMVTTNIAAILNPKPECVQTDPGRRWAPTISITLLRRRTSCRRPPSGKITSVQASENAGNRTGQLALRLEF
jgi:hypothetical protein